MIVVPTGGGKTVIFSHIIQHLNLKTLVIAHTKELISQCRKTLDRIGVLNTDVFSIQKVSMKRHKLDNYKLLIVDECHRTGASSYMKLINEIPNAKVIGVTATPFRHDGIKLKEIFGSRISPLNMMDMINDKLLSDFEGYRIKTNISLKGLKKSNGDLIASQLCSVINVKNRNELIVKEYTKISPGEKALCFAVNIAHSDELAKEFCNAGISASSVHGKTSKTERNQSLKNFKEGKIKILVNCQLLTEGFDEPSISCLLLARPTCSKVLYSQMIGRGSRLYPGKEVCKVIEFTDNDYDVSCLEDLMDQKIPTFPLQQGERLSSYGKRLSNFIGESDGTTFKEKMIIVPKSIYEKIATPWQRKYLSDKNILWEEPLTEFTANQLIIKDSNG